MTRPSSTQIAVLLLIIIGGALRFYHLGEKSLWVDEAKAVQISKHFEDILPYTQKGNTPPLRYYMSHYLQMGYPPETFLRLPSAIASLLCIPLIFGLGARMWNTKVGLLAAFFFTFSPWQIHHAQDGRMYSVFLFLIIASLYVLMRAQQSRRMRWYLVLGGLFALGSYLNYFALWTSFIITIYIAFILVIEFWRKKTSREPFTRFFVKGLAVTLIVAALLYLPWLVNVSSLLKKYDEPKVTSATVEPRAPGLNPFGTQYDWSYFDGFVKELGTENRFAAWALAALAAAGLIAAMQKRRDVFLLSILWFGIPLIILSLSSVRWFFPPRYLIYYHPVYLVLASIGIVAACDLAKNIPLSAPTQNRLRGAMILALLVFFLIPFAKDIQSYFRQEKQDWRGAARYLEQSMNPGDTLLTGQAWSEQAFMFYYRQSAKPVEIVMHLYDLAAFKEKLSTTPNLWYVTWGPQPEPVAQIINDHLEKVQSLPGALGAVDIYRRK